MERSLTWEEEEEMGLIFFLDTLKEGDSWRRAMPGHLTHFLFFMKF